MERLMLRPREAAELIGVSKTVFYRLLKSGEIPFCRIGKSIRIPVAALNAWVEAQSKKSAGNVQPSMAKAVMALPSPESRLPGNRKPSVDET